MASFSIGDEVYWVNWNDEHYGTIKAIQDGRVCVEYGAYADRGWFRPEQLRRESDPPDAKPVTAIFAKGDEVYWVNWNDEHYGKVIDVADGLVHVQYGPYEDVAAFKPEKLHHAEPVPDRPARR